MKIFFYTNFLVCLFLVSAVEKAYAQTPQYSLGTNAGTNSIPLSSGVATSTRCQFIYQAGEFGVIPTGMAISTIYVRVGTATGASTFSNFQVDVGQSSVTTLGGTTWETGLTNALTTPTFSVGAVTLSQWVPIVFTTPIPFDPSLTLIIDLRYSAYTGGISVRTQSLTAGRRQYANYASAAPTANSPQKHDFGFDLISLNKPTNDASISALVSPELFCPGTQTFKVRLANKGKNVINNVGIEWELNGATQTPLTWSFPIDTLGSADNDTVLTLGSTSFAVNDVKTLRVWTTLPNSAADTVNNNDTLYATVKPGLNGIYTIGPVSSDYISISAAINDLNKYGTCGPVTFNVAAGTSYTENPMSITRGGTALNPIVFQKSGTGANPIVYGTNGVGAIDAAIAIAANYITFDGIDVIDLLSNATTTTQMEFGYAIVNLSPTVGANYNTVKNAKITLKRTNTATIGLLQSFLSVVTALSGGNHNNRYENIKVENSYNGILLQGTAAYPDSNCVVTSVGPDSTIVGGALANDIGNGTAIVYGIQCFEQKNVEVSKCIVRNLTHTAALHSSGIWINNISTTSDYGTAKVFNNTIFNLSRTGTATTATEAMSGIRIEVSTKATAVVYNNLVYGLTTANPTAAMAASVLRGITHGVTGAGNAEYYNNSVLISQPALALLGSSACLWKGLAGTITYRNNIFSNTTPAQTGVSKHYGVYVSAGSVISSNNVIWAPNVNGFVGFATTDRATLPLYAAAVSLVTPSDGNETGSANANPNFTSATDLTFASNTPAAVSGIPISSYPITTDITGSPRSSTVPAIGAFETTQLLFDSAAPVISNVIIKSTALPVIYATVKDNTLANPSAGDIRLWYRSGTTGAFTAVMPDSVPFGNMNGTYKWSASFSALAIGTYQFYIAARDQIAQGSNIALNPIQGVGVSGFAGVDPVNYLNNPDAGVSTRSFVKTASLAGGTYSVGPTGTYTNLTAVATMLNTTEILGNIVFELQSGYNGTTGETFPITFTEFISTGGTWNIIIRPAAGATALETSGFPFAAGLPIIYLNGAKRIVFDGRPGGVGTTSQWTIRAKRSAAVTNALAMLFLNGAQKDTVRYMKLESGNISATSGTVHFSTTSTIGNNYNIISNCIIRNRQDTMVTGVAHAVSVYSLGTAGVTNDSNTITGNSITGFSNTGVFVTATGNGNGWVITNNSFYADTIQAAAQTAIRLESAAGKNTISGNFIGGTAPLCAGAAWVNTGAIAWRGIVSSSAQTDSSFLMNNTIQNISLTGGTGSFAGLELTGGLSSIRGNTIGHASTPNSIQTSQLGVIISIWLNSANNTAQIYNNTIANINSTGTTTAVGHNGIRVTTAVVTNPLVIRDNIISNLSAANLTTGTGTASMVGILSVYAGTNQTISNNAVSGLSNSAAAATSVFGINVSNASGAGSITGNKISNLKNTSTSNTAQVTGIHLDLTSGWSVVNNMIALGGSNDSAFILSGIQDKSAGTANAIYYNTVSISGNAFISSAGASQAYRRTTTSVATVRNNIFANTRTGGTGNYAIANINATPATGWKANYNDLYAANTATIGLWITTATDLATWKTTSLHDTSSVSLAPAFVSATDLHLTSPSLGDFNLAGRPLAGITTDIDGQSRSGVFPYMGADESVTNVLMTVELVNLSAHKIKDDVLLTWATASENNAHYFDIERSVDGKTFVSASSVKANGNTSMLSKYNYTDISAFDHSDIVYYRLKMVDVDGTFEYSKTVSVSTNSTQEEIMSVYPNPFDDNFSIVFTAAGSAKVNVYIHDIYGKTVATFTQQAIEGSNTILANNLSNLKAGLYFIVLENNGQKQVVKLMKQ